MPVPCPAGIEFFFNLAGFGGLFGFVPISPKTAVSWVFFISQFLFLVDFNYIEFNIVKLDIIIIDIFRQE